MRLIDSGNALPSAADTKSKINTTISQSNMKTEKTNITHRSLDKGLKRLEGWRSLTPQSHAAIPEVKISALYSRITARRVVPKEI